MATDDKKSLIIRREKHQVDHYIREIAEQNMPVRVVIDDTIVLDDCRLVLLGGAKRDLLIEASLAPGEYPETGRATVTCAGDSSLYTFATKVLSIELAEHRRMHLTIQYPDRVTKRERRRHVRVRPSATRPVSARIADGNGEAILPASLAQVVHDGADRKMVAAALASHAQFGEGCVAFAGDTDWHDWEDALAEHAVLLEPIIEAWSRAKHAAKQQR